MFCWVFMTHFLNSFWAAKFQLQLAFYLVKIANDQLLILKLFQLTAINIFHFIFLIGSNNFLLKCQCFRAHNGLEFASDNLWLFQFNAIVILMKIVFSMNEDSRYLFLFQKSTAEHSVFIHLYHSFLVFELTQSFFS